MLVACGKARCLQVDDLAAFTQHVRAGYESTMPMFLGGHSMGSLTSIHLALRDQAAWDGLILGTATVDVEWNWFLKSVPLTLHQHFSTPIAYTANTFQYNLASFCKKHMMVWMSWNAEMTQRGPYDGIGQVGAMDRGARG